MTKREAGTDADGPDDRRGTQPASTSESAVAYEVTETATVEDLERDTPYVGTVNGVVDYGVFVDLSSSLSGLVHESTLTSEHAVGDELIVELEDVRENGDLAFEPATLEEYAVEPLVSNREVTETAGLDDRDGEEVHLEGEIVQIKQTGGPTILHLRDERGVVPCAAFEEAGVRAYPDAAVGDAVRVAGTVERRNGSVQIEVDGLSVLSDGRESAVRERLATAVEERARPHEVEPLIEWPAFEKHRDELWEVARLLRRTVLSGRPIRIRHHADGDGMCAAVPVQIALERFIESVHEDPDAPVHLVRRHPSKAPFYEMEDATRDLTYALEDRARHGQKLPLLLMLDNGSTAEDVPAYETLAHYDIPLVAIDHHHPDPDAVGTLLDAHVNPYLHGEDYRITTGMLCVELARMIHPDITEELRHVPAVAGLSDRSKADAMTDYLELAATAGFDEERLGAVSEALDYTAYLLRYNDGKRLIRDVLAVDDANEKRHREVVSFLADRSKVAVEEQLEAVSPHVEREHLDNEARLFRIDLERFAHRFTYPAPGKTTGELHDRLIAESDDPAITIGYGPDFAVLRSDGVRLDIPRMVAELEAEVDGAGVSGGGHLVVGSIKFVQGKREAVIDALVEKMATADLDEDLTSAQPLTE